MDPIESINPKKDSTLAMMLAAHERSWRVSVFTQSDLVIQNSSVSIKRRQITPLEDLTRWFDVEIEDEVSADFFDVILMRKDPPFDMEYIYTTYLLERAEADGVMVVNRPGALRDCNEKMFANQFPECCPPVLVSGDGAGVVDVMRMHNCQAELNMSHAEQQERLFRTLREETSKN